MQKKKKAIVDDVCGTYETSGKQQTRRVKGIPTGCSVGDEG
jgi:hypothetical protein